MLNNNILFLISEKLFSQTSQYPKISGTIYNFSLINNETLFIQYYMKKRNIRKCADCKILYSKYLVHKNIKKNYCVKCLLKMLQKF